MAPSRHVPPHPAQSRLLQIQVSPYTDLDDACRTELQLQFSEALDDAFHGLLTPIENDLDNMRSQEAFRAVSGDLAALRRRQL